MKEVRQATEAELAYAAGIIDGEGCISIFEQNNITSQPQWRKQSDVRYRYKVVVKMVDPQAVRLLMEIFGGSFYAETPRKRGVFPVFKWDVTEKRAARCVEQLLPYLRVKKHRAELLLAFADSVKKCSYKGRGYRVPQEEREIRLDIISKVKHENQRMDRRKELGMISEQVN